ncbi:DUF6746 family protein [uncultured Halopseudomonas sp.]|jgi:hypothetical protein|uniref:DUF6746 family protein n=1 Tax=uncultured Halopseudomonas sp. TaxID=2901193 RepID=UPI0030ECD700|tara:strand:+ start:23855 stop:24223 length:369 start_codon:yes stop_codon:yes gene_type:complete
MRIYLLPLTLTAALMSPAMADAGDVSHYQAKAADSHEQAVANFKEYNGRLEALLAGELDGSDLAQVHELTYTLENALEKMRAEASEMALALEEVHLASERADSDAVRKHGKAYLGAAKTLIN